MKAHYIIQESKNNLDTREYGKTGSLCRGHGTTSSLNPQANYSAWYIINKQINHQQKGVLQLRGYRIRLKIGIV